MKKKNGSFRFLTILFLLLASRPVMAQSSFKDFFNDQTPITYLGVDFTDIRIAGIPDFDIRDMKERHFSSINNLVNTEAKKYDLSKFLHHSNVQIDISAVEEHNRKIDPDKIKSTGSNDDNRFTATSIDKMVRSYSFKGKKGIGVILFAETFSKAREGGVVHAAFVDLANGKVLYTEKFSEKGGGIGVRNYWAKVIFNTLDEMGDKYSSWKKANGM